MAEQLKPWSQAPFDETHQQFFDWIVSTLNSLVGQSTPPSQHGIQSLASPTGSPQAPVINPTGPILTSQGSRMSSIISPITAVMTPTTVTFYWDGSNGSIPFVVRRDDGTKFGPTIAGSPMLVTGLLANTKYFFYFYIDEGTQVIHAVNLPGISVGTPGIAFTAANLDAAQQQILKGRIQISPVFSGQGITTPNAGSTTVQGGVGGGGGGWGH